VLVKVFVVYVVFIRVSGARYERESDDAMNTSLSASYSQFKVASVVLGCKYLERLSVAYTAVWVCLVGLQVGDSLPHSCYLLKRKDPARNRAYDITQI